MPGITTLSGTLKNIVFKQADIGSIAECFPCDATDLVPGVPLKLLSTGKVAAIAAATEVPIGIYNNANKEYLPGDDVTVLTHFLAICYAQANTAITTGDLLSCVGFDATTKRGDYDNAGAIVSAVCLVGAADNAEITIGIFRCPFPRPA